MIASLSRAALCLMLLALPALAQDDFNFTQLPDDLFRPVLFRRHSSSLP